MMSRYIFALFCERMKSMLIPSITSDELERLLENDRSISIIDVREDEEVAFGKIPEARHIRLQELPDRLNELDRTRRHYIICHAGARSYHACRYLQALGFDVVNVEGGMRDWQGEVK